MTSHGGDVAAVVRANGLERREIVDLSASMNPCAPDVRPFLSAALDEVLDYPDNRRATAALAEVLGVDRSRLVLTNGGAEAIALVAQHLGSGSIVDPEFSLYRRHLDEVTADGPRWRSNPSNPLGVLAAADEQAYVWDEAFLPLTAGMWTNGAGAWQLGSLTKLWACPGLRLGYAIAPDEGAAKAIAMLQPEWSVNSLAAAVVEPLLAVTELTVWAAEVAALRDEFCERLLGAGIDVQPTAANWVLVRTACAADSRQRLIQRGVLVRDCSNFGLPDLCRVALPRRQQLESVIRAFEHVGDRS